ncbi:hypothetical protein ACFXNW_29785 [Nocardia sp. NPDC059180]|uniref:hypothetical protein n=1 Tax=Nocardia sp. NPDC059180 TaxID=3346761 RepID=UPI0036AACFBD
MFDVVVNTVNYVCDTLDGTQSGVAMLLAANGFGTMLVALSLPRVFDRVGARPVLLTGAATFVTGLVAAPNPRETTNFRACHPRRVG